MKAEFCSVLNEAFDHFSSLFLKSLFPFLEVCNQKPRKTRVERYTFQTEKIDGEDKKVKLGVSCRIPQSISAAITRSRAHLF